MITFIMTDLVSDIMERVAGESIDDLEMRPWFTGGGAKLRELACRAWVSTFAGLARLAPLALLGAAIAPEDDACRWRHFAAKANSTLLVAMLDRLLAVPA